MTDNIIADAVAESYDGRVQKFQIIHNKITQRQLQMRMLKKGIYLQKKDEKSLIILIILILM